MRISEAMRESFALACRTDAVVLITGPTGAGKTALAESIHIQGTRAKRPFVVVNLASLHEGTFESELFGHERGAFTGADQRRIGKLESAQGGTVFLDEIGELPFRLQSRLLEFLQTRCISPVGGNRVVRLDVRVIAATHKDLPKAVREKQFREDLLHRLRVICMDLPPICNRGDEFDELVHSCLADLSQFHGRKVLRISDEVAKALESYDWPGNIRELRNVLEYAVIATTGTEISARHLPYWFCEAMKKSHSPFLETGNHSGVLGTLEVPLSFNYNQLMADFEKELLSRALHWTRGRINQTARKLGMSKATLIRRMRAYGLYCSSSNENSPVLETANSHQNEWSPDNKAPDAPIVSSGQAEDKPSKPVLN